MADDIRMSLDEIFDFSKQILAECGCSDQQAGSVAASVRDAEGEGIRNVGLGYMPIYCKDLAYNRIRGDAVPVWRETAPGAIVVDAGLGFAHPAFEHGLAPYVERVAATGIATLAIENSYSAGVLGWFTEKLADHGLITLAFANSPARMAVAGGKRRFFGTNPISFAVPRPNGPALVADFATSQTAFVNVKDHAKAGKPIPAGWGLDADGKPTDDAKAVIESGTMAPMGGAKGAILALLVDVLAGGLGGPNFSHQAPEFGVERDEPPAVGQFFIAIDPNATGRSGYGENIETLVTAMLKEPGVRLPGQRRLDNRASAQTKGVMVPPALLETIRAS